MARMARQRRRWAPIVTVALLGAFALVLVNAIPGCVPMPVEESSPGAGELRLIRSALMFGLPAVAAFLHQGGDLVCP